MKKVGNGKNKGLTPIEEINTDKVDDIGILFYKDERNYMALAEDKNDNEKSDVGFGAEISAERFSSSPIDTLKKSLNKTVEKAKIEEMKKRQETLSQQEEDKKSVSMRVTLRASDRTLTVEEADKTSEKILRALNQRFHITLRA